MEVLEEKVPLASDLAVDLVNGDLILTGDDNAISIAFGMFLDSGDKSYRITAQDADDTITFNGIPVVDETQEGYPTLLVTGVTRDIRINLGGGDDTIYVLGQAYLNNVVPVQTYVPRDLVIDLGAGNDFVSVGVPNNVYEGQSYTEGAPTGVGRDVVLTGGNGNDTLVLSGTIIGDDLSVSDTQGDNVVDVFSKNLFADPMEEPGSNPLFDTIVTGDVSVTTGSGSDVVGIATLVGGGNITTNTGGGDDTVLIADFATDGSILVNAGAGINDVRVEFGTVGGGVLMSGSGANVFQANLLDVASAIVMLGSNADDQFYFHTTTAGSAIAISGGGADYVQLIDSAFDLLTVSLGAGNDTLYMDGVSATLAVLLGGGGSDTLLESADNDFLMAIDLSFEFPEAI